MSDELQPLIDKWWAGLTPEERGEWWSEGDRVHSLGDDYTVISVFPTGLVVADKFGSHVATPQTSVPIACPQLWWKLEAWLVEQGKHLTIYVRPNETYQDMQYGQYEVYEEESYPDKTQTSLNGDRRHALLDACLAVQEEKGGTT